MLTGTIPSELFANHLSHQLLQLWAIISSMLPHSYHFWNSFSAPSNLHSNRLTGTLPIQLFKSYDHFVLWDYHHLVPCHNWNQFFTFTQTSWFKSAGRDNRFWDWPHDNSTVLVGQLVSISLHLLIYDGLIADVSLLTSSQGQSQQKLTSSQTFIFCKSTIHPNKSHFLWPFTLFPLQFLTVILQWCGSQSVLWHHSKHPFLDWSRHFVSGSSPLISLSWLCFGLILTLQQYW